MKVATRGLFWFRHDLRVSDMPALTALSKEVDELILVYVRDDRMLRENPFGLNSLGPHRELFIDESLQSLNEALVALGQRLHVVSGEPVASLTTLINHHHVTHIASHFHGGFYEMDDWQKLKESHSSVTFIQLSGCTLFDCEQLPFSLADMPVQFTPFRKQIEKHISPELPEETISTLPPPVSDVGAGYETAESSLTSSGLFRGGEHAGQQRVNDYFFNNHHVATYKETRNALDDVSASTRFSPWLASGSLSPRWIYQQLKRYENEHVANESTYWVYFELLWREFFFWAQQRHGANWFSQSGLRGEVRPFNHDENAIQRWQQGETGYDIVDACMKQLNATGFMSNRGRQLVASCFVHELGQNWQYGAAWFEHMLVDFDVGSNWGNWLYLAGVGHDPRGHRQFDLNKQTEIYDPERKFISKWL